MGVVVNGIVWVWRSNPCGHATPAITVAAMITETEPASAIRRSTSRRELGRRMTYNASASAPSATPISHVARGWRSAMPPGRSIQISSAVPPTITTAASTAVAISRRVRGD